MSDRIRDAGDSPGRDATAVGVSQVTNVVFHRFSKEWYIRIMGDAMYKSQSNIWRLMTPDFSEFVYFGRICKKLNPSRVSLRVWHLFVKLGIRRNRAICKANKLCMACFLCGILVHLGNSFLFIQKSMTITFPCKNPVLPKTNLV